MQNQVTVSLEVSPYMATVLRVQFSEGSLELYAGRKDGDGIPALEQAAIDSFIKGLEQGRFEVHAVHTSRVAANLLANVLGFADPDQFESFREDVDTFGSTAEQRMWLEMDANSRALLVQEAETVGRSAQKAWDEIKRYSNE